VVYTERCPGPSIALILRKRPQKKRDHLDHDQPAWPRGHLESFFPLLSPTFPRLILPKFPPQKSSSASLSCHSPLVCRLGIHRRSATSRPFGVSKASLSPYQTALAPMGRVGKQHLRCPEARGQQESETLPERGQTGPKDPMAVHKSEGRGSSGFDRCQRMLGRSDNHLPCTAVSSSSAMLPAPHPPVKQRGKRLSPEPKSPWQ
jgi:hypothetical protein